MTKSLCIAFVLLSMLACSKSTSHNPGQPTLTAGVFDESSVSRSPFELFGQLIIIDVEDPQGTHHTFMLDTGASFSVLDKSVADAFGARPYVAEDGSILAKKVQSASGKEVDLGQLQVMPSMKVGDFEFTGEVGAFVADLAPVRHVSGLNVRGILGFQALQLPFTIDYPRRELRLNVAGLKADDPGVVAVEDNNNLYSPNIVLSVGGRQSLALIDTGSGECMAIPETFAKTLPYAVAPVATGFSQTISGTTEDFSGRLDLKVELAGHIIEKPIVDFMEPDYYRLGGALLKNFEITFDPNKALAKFVRTAQGTAGCDSVVSIGFYVGRTENDQWVVALLLPGSDALDIKAGDLLQTINGQDARSMSKPGMKELWRHESEIRVTLVRAGETIERVVPVQTLVP